MANEENLKPWQKGQSGNPNGRPKGSKNLATIARELENEDFDWELVPSFKRGVAKDIGSPWRAIVFAAMAKAVEGDLRAAEWLRKACYGDRVVVEDETEQEKPMVTLVKIIDESTTRE